MHFMYHISTHEQQWGTRLFSHSAMMMWGDLCVRMDSKVAGSLLHRTRRAIQRVAFLGTIGEVGHNQPIIKNRSSKS
jgi:hypothetical protein